MHVDGLGIVEAESAADVKALQDAFGKSSSNGHAAAASVPDPTRLRPTLKRNPSLRRRPRPRRGRVSERKNVAPPPSDASRDDRLLYLAGRRTPAQDALYRVLIDRPEGVSDAQGRELLKISQGQFGGLIMSISRDANAAGLKIDDDVILRKRSWGGGKRACQYILRESMREALLMT